MDYLKANGEASLRPAMRRLILWGMATPFILYASGVFFVFASIVFEPLVYVAAILLLFALTSSVTVIVWGFWERNELRREPIDFRRFVNIMIALNIFVLLCFLSLATKLFSPRGP